MAIQAVRERGVVHGPAFKLTHKNNGAANALTVKLVPGTILFGFKLAVTTAFNSTTADTLMLTDDTTVFEDDTSLRTPYTIGTDQGATTDVGVFKVYPKGGTLSIYNVPDGATAATAGEAYIVLLMAVAGEGGQVITG